MAWAAGVGASAGANAAAARRRRMEQEEETLTSYSPQELDEDWEFKIVRSATQAFRKPQVLRRLVEEEARAGWIMLEKFDDQRVRFKRLRGVGLNNPALGIDPYRSYYGLSPNRYALLIVVPLLVFVIGFVLVALSLGSRATPQSRSLPTPNTRIVIPIPTPFR